MPWHLQAPALDLGLPLALHFAAARLHCFRAQPYGRLPLPNLMEVTIPYVLNGPSKL